jgi:hypothetical protein
MIVHVNPNTVLPQAIINFCMKNLAGVLLYLYQRTAMKIAKDPNTSHAHRIREDKEFYCEWLLPKIRAYCDLKGWPQPIISSLGEDGIPKTADSSVKENDGKQN